MRYGTDHQRLRRRVAREIALGLHVCARCGYPIVAGQRWHLDHTDDGAGYLGPSHQGCNVRAANERRAALARAALDAGLDVESPVRSASREW